MASNSEKTHVILDAMRCLLEFIVITPILLLQTGCVTSAIWQEARASEVSYPRLVGGIHDDPNDVNRVTGVVFDYLVVDSASGRHYHVVVPLTNDGSPIAPFAYHGARRTVDEIARDLSASQKSAVAGYRFKKEAFENAERLMRSTDYTRFPSATAGHPSDVGATLPGGRIQVFGLRPDGSPTGGMEHVDHRWSDHFPEDCKILILPDSQLRPFGERAWALTLAIALTPLTLPFDIVTFPLQLWYIISVGR